MTTQTNRPVHTIGADEVLRRIAEGTASATGEQFFRILTSTLGGVLGTYGAWVTEYLENERALHGLAFWLDGTFVENYFTYIDNTPCEIVVTEKRLVHYPDRLLEIFDVDPEVAELRAVSYMGVPLLDAHENVMGHLAVIDRKPMQADPQIVDVFRIFAARAAAELQRVRAERELRDREEKLGRLVTGAMDAIIELDGDLRISQINPAAATIFRCTDTKVANVAFEAFLAGDSGEAFRRLVVGIGAGRQSMWVPGGLRARTLDGEVFPAEATVSGTQDRGKRYYTVVLRNVNDRLEAEKRIQALTSEREYLKEELRELHVSETILGKSAAIERVLDDIKLVAEADTTVLILGETGTGKELIARAVHQASPRRERPLIKVNCAAIPSNLMESEFFGHERGAFTGATERREGRFALADGGTIFLDEVGDLPLDLQSKLLRVLQEGEFEPVGSSQTRKVDVRVIAATNRNLEAEVAAGRFREDLFYRLNVFPLNVPPLRERADDVLLLAEAFAERYSKRIGRTIDRLTDSGRQRLTAYAWPGNVRELQNVIERAVLTSVEGRLNLERALPAAADSKNGGRRESAPSSGILTVEELQNVERDNIRRALEQCGWRVSGETGAAKLLGINPSTLSSRMKALGIARPKAH